MIKISKNLLSLVLILSVSACSSWFKRKEEPIKVEPVLETAVPVKDLSAPAIAQPAEPIQPEVVDLTAGKELGKESYIDQKYSEKTEVEKTESHVNHKTHFIPAEKSLGWLKNGNKRFLKNNLRRDGQSKMDIKRLSKEQSPHAVVLSCSDSRVPPEIIFDQKLGEIFVVRTAGEIPDSAVIASIEYAIEHLGAKLILVMGHTSCGAVKTALAIADGGDAGSTALNALVQDIRPRIADLRGQSTSTHLAEESWANAKGVAKDLIERSTLIKNKIATGEVQIVSSLYNLDSGKVEFEK